MFQQKRNPNRNKRYPLRGLTICSDIRDQTKLSTLKSTVSDLGGKVLENELDSDEKNIYAVVTDTNDFDEELLRKKPQKFSIILREAQSKKIRLIKKYEKCMEKLRELEEKAATAKKKRHLEAVGGKKTTLVRDHQTTPKAPHKVPFNLDERDLKAPFLKVTDKSERFKPQVQEFTDIPTIHLEKARGKSVFHAAESSSPKNQRKQSDENSEHLEVRRSPRKGLKLARDRRKGLHLAQNLRLRDQQIAPKRKTNYFCEICHLKLMEDGEEAIQMHLSSARHKENVERPGFYAEVDREINEGKKLDEFLTSVMEPGQSENMPEMRNLSRMSELTDVTYEGRGTTSDTSAAQMDENETPDNGPPKLTPIVSPMRTAWESKLDDEIKAKLSFAAELKNRLDIEENQGRVSPDLAVALGDLNLSIACDLHLIPLDDLISIFSSNKRNFEAACELLQTGLGLLLKNFNELTTLEQVTVEARKAIIMLCNGGVEFTN